MSISDFPPGKTTPAQLSAARCAYREQAAYHQVLQGKYRRGEVGFDKIRESADAMRLLLARSQVMKEALDCGM